MKSSWKEYHKLLFCDDFSLKATTFLMISFGGIARYNQLVSAGGNASIKRTARE